MIKSAAAATPKVSSKVEQWAKTNLDALQKDKRVQTPGGLQLKPADVEKASKDLGIPKAQIVDHLSALESKLVADGHKGRFGASVYGHSGGPAVGGGAAAAKGRSLGAHQFTGKTILSSMDRSALEALRNGNADVKALYASPPGDMAKARAAVIGDLKEVPVQGPGGQTTNVLDKLMNDPAIGLSDTQRNRVLDVLAESKHNFAALEKPGGNYQEVNWKHTRGEVDQVMESCKLNKLSPNQTEDALMASIFSDCIKSPANFITHNVDGARAAAVALRRHFGGDEARIHGVVQATLEHQIGPPKFMAMMVMGTLNRALGDKAGQHKDTIASIQLKVADPLNNRTSDGRQVDFSDAEQALLQQAGIPKWSTPQEGNAWSKASRALIDGDSLINYASPDGWAKLAAIRGPDTLPFFEDPICLPPSAMKGGVDIPATHPKSGFPQMASLQSAQESFDDAYSVVSEGAKPLADAGLKRTHDALGRVYDDMEQWLAQQGDRVPRNDQGKVPFWNTALTYPSHMEGGQLSPKQQVQFDFAKEIRSKVVDLLRAEQGNY